ncbi:hypothetical protein MASR2M16_18020 [Thauera terpenica]
MLNVLRAPSGAQITVIKVIVFLLCLIPAANLAMGWQNDALGADPIETISRSSGQWTLRFLLISLAVTPLRRYTGLHWLIRLRRMLGLFVFAYASGHLLSYVWLDQSFDWRSIARDILDRPFITVGFSAFVLLIPLAATSNSFALRRLGGRRWQALHRSSYGIAVLGVVHFWWLVKAGVFTPLIYALVLAALLGLRAWWRELERRRQLSTPPPAKHLKRPVIRILPK